MRISILLLIACGLTVESRAQKTLTLLPSGEVKIYNNGEIKSHRDKCTDGNRIRMSDSGQVFAETYLKDCKKNGYRKVYENGIMVSLELFKDDVSIGTHYFWDKTGILKKAVTYENGKEVSVKEY